MRVLLIQAHPDPAGGHFGNALAESYAAAAVAADHEVKTIVLAKLDIPFLRNAIQWERDEPPVAIRDAQKHIAWAEHIVVVFPLWLGDMPALLKAFLEQALRPGFALGKPDKPGRMMKKLLKGKSARLIVTMGMPAFFYRLYFRSHILKSMKRNVLQFCGISPVRTTVIGMIEGSPSLHERWLSKVAVLGGAAA